MLTSTLVPAIASLTPSQSEELCPQHPNEQLIAFDKESNSLLCNRCIYEGSLQDDTNLAFTALIAQDLKEMLDLQFQQYRAGKDSFQQSEVSDPNRIIGTINSKIEGFFTSLEKHLESLSLDIEDHIVSQCVKPEAQNVYSSASQTIQSHNPYYEQQLRKLEELIEEKLFSKITEDYQQYEQTIKAMSEEQQSLQNQAVALHQQEGQAVQQVERRL